MHNPNGRFVVVCGDGEYIIYTALAWRNKSFGTALDFAWSVDSSEFAVRLPRAPSSTLRHLFAYKETLVSVAEFSTAAVTEARRVGCTGADARVDVAHQDVQELPREEVHPSQLRRRGDPRWPAAVRTLRGVHLLLRLGRVPRHPPHRRGGEGHLVGGERRAGELLAEASRSHPVASHPPPSTVSHTTSPTTIFHRCVCGSSPTPNVICTSALIRHRGTVCACNHLSLSLSAALRLVV